MGHMRTGTGEFFGFSYTRQFQSGARLATDQTMREARKSEPPYGGVTAGRSSRNTAHAGSENAGPSLNSSTSYGMQRGRMNAAQVVPTSTRLPFQNPNSSVGAANGMGALARPSPRNTGVPLQTGSVLGDITNMVQSSTRSLSKPQKQLSHSQQQALPGSAVALPVPVPSLEPAPMTAVPAVVLVAQSGSLSSRSEEAFGVAFECDSQDVQRVSEYATEIMGHLFDEESAFLPRADYMEDQSDINGKMRAILIDWLVEVHMKYRLRPETLFLAINIIDRYLSMRSVMRKKLQLLGVVAMFIAAKFEEIDSPKVHEFAYITDHTYTTKEIINMESTVLMALDFQIAVPTPAHFLDRLERSNGCDVVHRALAQYVLELSLLDLRGLKYSPSWLVAGSLLLSNEILGRRPVWPAAMVHHTRKSEKALRACVDELRSIMEGGKVAPLQAVQRKYRLEQNFVVANLVAGKSRD